MGGAHTVLGAMEIDTEFSKRVTGHCDLIATHHPAPGQRGMNIHAYRVGKIH